MNIGIWANTSKQSFWDLLPEVLPWLQDRGQEVYLTQRIETLWQEKQSHHYSVIESADDFLKLDFLFAMGGDGTILSAARAVGARQTPILGVHLGGFGFLAEGTVENLYSRLESVIEGNYTTYPRMVISAKIDDGNKAVTALNDLVIDIGEGFRLMKCSLYTGGRLVTSYSADGLIISTPTGSTAYNLAAGGPIITPVLSLFTVTPICPHTLSSRPIVLPTESALTITFPDGEPGARLTADGQVEHPISQGGKVVITK
ncbi:MAG: NAD(+)/NADH kinase, partial [Candidatus Marinimicrobia bacterium]|nr:NAD(+)/NADH kinase [Candidatus Neomarinimicrobiota bacterium]